MFGQIYGEWDHLKAKYYYAINSSVVFRLLNIRSNNKDY